MITNFYDFLDDKKLKRKKFLEDQQELKELVYVKSMVRTFNKKYLPALRAYHDKYNAEQIK